MAFTPAERLTLNATAQQLDRDTGNNTVILFPQADGTILLDVVDTFDNGGARLAVVAGGKYSIDIGSGQNLYGKSASGALAVDALWLGA